MELNFSELDNITEHTPNNNSTEIHNYWERPTIISTKQPKKKESFEDILSNMSLTVNKNGTLQSIVTKKNEHGESYNIQPQQYQNYNAQPNNKQQTPIDPSVKHSYIYNKYFKDYKDVIQPLPEIKTPKTKEEYFQLMNEEKIRRIQEAKRIAQIKSKKLLFTTNNVYHQSNIKPTTNKLHKLNFK